MVFGADAPRIARTIEQELKNEELAKKGELERPKRAPHELTTPEQVIIQPTEILLYDLNHCFGDSFQMKVNLLKDPIFSIFLPKRREILFPFCFLIYCIFCYHKEVATAQEKIEQEKREKEAAAIEAARYERREARARRLEMHFADICPALMLPHAQKNLRKVTDTIESFGEIPHTLNTYNIIAGEFFPFFLSQQNLGMLSNVI